MGTGYRRILGGHPVSKLELVVMKKITVYALRPDRATGYKTAVSNSLENLQRFVGGYIETVTLFNNLVIICNEEGRLKNLDYCCTILGHDFYGPVLIAGVKGDEFDDLPFPDIRVLRQLLGVK